MGKAGTAVLAAVLGLAGCGGSEGSQEGTSGNTSAPPRGGADVPVAVAVEPLPRGAWTELAHALVEARALEDSVDATREILARGGIATTDGERLLVQSISPASRLQATPQEAVHLAMEARHRPYAGTLTIAELAQLLEGLGWPFPDADPDADAYGAAPAIAPADDDIYRDMVDAERDAARDAERTAERAALAADDARREAASARDAELVQGIQEATLAWQKARQAASKTAPADRAAADLAVKAAWDTRQAAIDARNAARIAADESRDADRAANLVAEESEYLREQVEGRIGPDPVQGERLMAMLGDWVRAAAADPDNPESFTPLFLAEMARLQDAPVDLLGSRYARPGRGEGPEVDLRGAPRAQQLRWTLLELELFAAAFDRGAGDRRRQAGVGQRLADALLPTAHAASPCGDFKEWLDKQAGGAGDAASTVAGLGTGRAIDAAAGAAMSSATKEAFGKAMSALGMVAKLAKLAAFYRDEQATVTPDPVSVHKPTGDMKLVWFTARAGISKEDWDEYQEAMGEATKIDRSARDCMDMMGLPRFADAVDVANDAENWFIEWRLSDGGGDHVYYNLRASKFDLPGRLAMKMKRESETTAVAKLGVDIRPEREHSGKVVRAYATAEARVDAAGMPSPFSMIAGIFGGPAGLADAVLELLTGWYQAMNMPKAYGTMEIEYHCPRPGRLHRPTGKENADGAGDPGPDECLLSAQK